MWNKKMKRLLLLLLGCMMLPISAYALGESLEYTYTTENPEEFVIGGTSFLNFGGEVADYLYDIYDITPQTTYTSEYGTNVIVPSEETENYTTYAPKNSPVSGTYVASSSGTITGQLTSEYQYIAEEYETYNLYQTTGIADVRNEDGSIGTLTIDAIDLKVTAYDGDTYEAMAKGIGHVASTSAWDGNIGLLGHNRGTNDYFGDLEDLELGDTIEYKTTLGTREYEVDFIGIISDTDWTKLQYTVDNRITLITCVADQSDKRLVVQGVEID
ncbi:class D sortase [Chakrabartyella piscis]|uniref:class D sortase n=1 Tax=Chakrabartyella piscis TaxID=2918914 RepID=UPI00295887E3|nr:class D sortase [Chakrabartyella piscis]